MSGGTSVLSCTVVPVQALCVGVEVSGEKIRSFV